MAHAFGVPINLGTMELPPGVVVPAGSRALLQTQFDALMEQMILMNPPTGAGSAGPGLEMARKMANVDTKFAQGQAELASKIDENNLRGRLSDVMSATGLVDILEPLVHAWHKRGIDPDSAVLNRASAERLLELLPSRWVEREMRRLRHRNKQQPWHPHDLNDINALSVAVPYCDVVVTERQWARHLNDCGVARRFNTIVMHDLSNLDQVLVEASAR